MPMIQPIYRKRGGHVWFSPHTLFSVTFTQHISLENQELQSEKNTMTHAGGVVSQKPMRLHLTK